MAEFTKDEQRKIEIAGQSTEAVHQHVAPFAVSIIDIETADIASGTLVEMGPRLLVATAGHCIPGNPNGRLWLLAGRPRKASDGMLGILNNAKHAVHDVGFLEVASAAAKEYFEDKAGCPMTRLDPCGWGQAKSLATLIGTPAARVDKEQSHLGLPAMAARVDAYTSPFLPPEQWPDRGDGHLIGDEASSIIIEYPEDASRLDTGERMQTYDPGGFSGGGIWRQSFNRDELWSPDKVCLVGLQTGWYPSLRCLHGAQIGLWIQLVFDHYPDLQPLLHHAFPNVV